MNRVQVLITEEDKRMVKKLAEQVFARYVPPGLGSQVTATELYHYGIIGLIEAIGDIDRSQAPAAQRKYKSIRAYRIMMEHLPNHLTPVPLPKEQHRRVKQLQAAKREMERDGEPADTKSLARRLDWTDDEVQRVGTLSPRMVCVEDTNTAEEDGNYHERTVLADPARTPEAEALCSELPEIMDICLGRIPDAQARLILVARILEDRTLKTLAEMFQRSIEWVRKKEIAAKDRMKNCLEFHGWSDLSATDAEGDAG